MKCVCAKNQNWFFFCKIFRTHFYGVFSFLVPNMAYYKFLFLFLDVLCAKLVVAICEFFWAKLLVLVVVVCSSKNYNSLSEKGPTSTSHKSNLSTNKILESRPKPKPSRKPNFEAFKTQILQPKWKYRGSLIIGMTREKKFPINPNPDNYGRTILIIQELLQ